MNFLNFSLLNSKKERKKIRFLHTKANQMNITRARSPFLDCCCFMIPSLGRVKKLYSPSQPQNTFGRMCMHQYIVLSAAVEVEQSKWQWQNYVSVELPVLVWKVICLSGRDAVRIPKQTASHGLDTVWYHNFSILKIY